jgi:uncharacterized protein YjbJ (UPF0337 family)
LVIRPPFPNRLTESARTEDRSPKNVGTTTVSGQIVPNKDTGGGVHLQRSAVDVAEIAGIDRFGHPPYRDFTLRFGWGTLWLRGGQDSKLCGSVLPLRLNLRHWGGIVSQGSKDEIEGKVEEVKGKIKEKVGRATNNPRLEDEGTDQEVAGKVQKKVGQVEKVFED